MTDLERQDMAVACCVCCSLAEAMKTCKTCTFRIGMGVRTIHLEIMQKRFEQKAWERAVRMYEIPPNLQAAYLHYISQ